MDQVIAFLKALKKHHFWVLCTVVSLMAVVAWYLSTNKLAQAYDKAKSDIDGKMSALRRISTVQNHPNTKIHKRMDDEVVRRRDNVLEAWETKWKQSIDILTWPEELTREFVETAQKLQPIEKFSPDDPEQLRAGFLDEYRDYIKEELPKIAKMIGTQWVINDSQKGPGGGRGFGVGGMSPMRMGAVGQSQGSLENESIVYWDPADQQRIEEEHFDWSNQPRNRPTTLQVLYAQEDLWVLTALLRIIQATNEGAVTNSSASVKNIVFIRFGHDAVEQEGDVEFVEGGDGAQSGRSPRSSSANFGEGGGPRGGPRGPMGGIGDIGTGELEDVDPADYRYVDEKYETLSGTDIRGLAAGTTANPLLAVAKRMPIRFRLVMDQRNIDNLLIECANSKLIVEVRQIRFNPDVAVEGAPAGRGEGSGGGRQPSRSRSRGGRRSSGGFDLGIGSSFGRSSQGGQEEEGETYNIEVEFYGIIYVYNPVDREVLGYDEPA